MKRIEINNAALRGIVWVQAGIATVNEKLREDRGDFLPSELEERLL